VARRGFIGRIADAFSEFGKRVGETFGGPAAPPSRKSKREMRRFARGKTVSGRTAERYARQRDQIERDQYATRRGQAARRKVEREARPENDFRQAWMQEHLSRPGRTYQKNIDMFRQIPGVAGEPHDEQVELWRSYINNMVRGAHRRNDPANPFWSDIGLHPSDFDWDAFRTAMGYKARHG
jgi:hypothetical protein